MELSQILLLNAMVILGLMIFVWLTSLALRDASLVDRWWGAGYVIVATVTFLFADQGFEPRMILLLALAGIWGLRLSLYLTWRNWGAGEDRRYQKMRSYWGAARFLWVSFLTVFLLQGVLMWLVSLPLQIGQASPTPAQLNWVDGLGALLWLCGILFEAVGDAQLARFKADPANRLEVMDRGLWRYTRHPNYFGDALLWWGLFVIAAQTEHGLWALASPLIMTFLLTRISGVPMLERDMARRKPSYADYIERTSAFFPWPPKQAPRRGNR
jgi:steroid 5-alpha reductase family enzyme